MARIGLLSLLTQLFETVFVPPAVIAEATRDLDRPGARRIHQALANSQLTERPVSAKSAELTTLTLALDEGEAEALALAQELQLSALIDERKGRRVAKQLGIGTIGTGAVLIAAKRAALIPAVAPCLEQLRQYGYHLSPTLIATILHRSGED